MNQKLSDWASIAEIVSGIAVVVTLVFLVLEIREGTNVTRASMYASTLDSLIENRTQRIENPELDRVVQSFLEGNAREMDVSDRGLLVPFLQNVYQIYEKAYYSMKYGVIGDSEWARFERIICMNYSRVVSGSLSNEISAVISQDFWEYIMDTCSR